MTRSSHGNSLLVGDNIALVPIHIALGRIHLAPNHFQNAGERSQIVVAVREIALAD